MKSPLLLSVAAIVGFASAWLLKPSASIPEPVIIQADATPAVTKKVDRGSLADPRTSVSTRTRVKDVDPSEFPLVDLVEAGPKTRDEAKMLRLTEALGLTIDQQGAIIRLIEESPATTDNDLPIIEDLAKRGKAVEDALASILSPEQFAKFQELRAREDDNRIESRAQRELTKVIEHVDLSPQQREEALVRLRQSVRAELQEIPASATLLLESSALPTSKTELSVDGVLLLAQLAGRPAPNPSDPAAVYEQVQQNHRASLEARLKNYEEILTPAQLGQYYAIVVEKKQAIERISEANRAQAK